MFLFQKYIHNKDNANFENIDSFTQIKNILSDEEKINFECANIL